MVVGFEMKRPLNVVLWLEMKRMDIHMEFGTHTIVTPRFHLAILVGFIRAVYGAACPRNDRIQISDRIFSTKAT